MTPLMTTLAVAALLGCAAIGGVFFAFSSFIMKSLSRLPAEAGISAMQSINEVVLNRSFLGLFMGTAAISLIFIVLSVVRWDAASAGWFLCGGLLYFAGTFLVTGMGNVPLNNRLADVSAIEASAVPVWEHYLARWTFLNTLRAAAALAAALMFTLGVIGGSNV